MGVSRFSGTSSSAPVQGHRAGQDVGQDGQGVDAGVEHAQSAGLPDPGLAGVPHPHVLPPFDLHGPDRAARPAAPAPAPPPGRSGSARPRAGCGLRARARSGQGQHLGHRGAGRLLHQHVLARGQGGGGQGAAADGRGAQRHGVQPRLPGQHGGQVRVVRHLLQPGARVEATGGQRASPARPTDRRHVLVPARSCPTRRCRCVWPCRPQDACRDQPTCRRPAVSWRPQAVLPRAERCGVLATPESALRHQAHPPREDLSPAPGVADPPTPEPPPAPR